MGQYLIKRFLIIIPSLFIITVFVFFMLRILPGDAVLMILADTPHSVQMRAALRSELGLDKPAIVQYLIWLARMFDGSFGGRSFETGDEIGSMVGEQLPVTFLLAGYTFVFSVLWALPAGIVAGHRSGRVSDRFLRFFALVGLSIPNILAASMILLGLLKVFRWSPPIIYTPPGEDGAAHFQIMLWPVLILSFEYGSHLLRAARNAVAGVLKSPFIRGAKARGVPPFALLFRHAMPPVLAITISLAGAHFGALIGGALVLEAVFGLPGIGRGLVQAAVARDFPVIQSYVVILVGLYLLLNMAADLLYSSIDPRLRTPLS
ncbi:MAG: ABC transporter permease, partial [Spirochaetales bacterium]|nr:ABC transporter permease [Spirochaetales bacterium]